MKIYWASRQPRQCGKNSEWWYIVFCFRFGRMFLLPPSAFSATQQSVSSAVNSSPQHINDSTNSVSQQLGDHTDSSSQHLTEQRPQEELLSPQKFLTSPSSHRLVFSQGNSGSDLSMCTLLDGWYTFSVVSFTVVSFSSGILPLVSRLCGIQANYWMCLSLFYIGSIPQATAYIKLLSC